MKMTGRIYMNKTNTLVFTADREALRKKLVRKCWVPERNDHTGSVKVIIEVVD